MLLNAASLRKRCVHSLLRTLSVADGTGSAEAQALERIVILRRPMARGARLFKPGDTLTALYFAREGALKTVSLEEDGEERILGFQLPGEIVGLDALATGFHRCDAMAMTTVHACELPFAELLAITAQLPALRAQFTRVIGSSISRDQRHIALLGTRDAQLRIALFLHGLGERYRHPGYRTASLELPMTRKEIANYLGLALETVSRGLSRLQQYGVIRVQGRLVEILDAERLRAVSHIEQSSITQRRAQA